jgi:hypothetical protein
VVGVGDVLLADGVVALSPGVAAVAEEVLLHLKRLVVGSRHVRDKGSNEPLYKKKFQFF